MKKLFLFLFLYLLLGFILFGQESTIFWYGRQSTMLGGLIDGFFLPARWLATMIVPEVNSFPPGRQTVYHKLGMILGIVSFLGVAVTILKKKK